MQCFPVPQLHGTCWPAAALPPDGSTASSGFSPAQHTAFLPVADHLVLGVGQYVFWFSLFCIAAVSGSMWMSPNWNAGSDQASSPSSFPSKHPHASSSPPLLPRPWPFWTLAAFLTPLFSEPPLHLWLVCTPHNLRSLSACFTPRTLSHVQSHLDLVARSQL